jgi:hypothetical protein
MILMKALVKCCACKKAHQHPYCEWNVEEDGTLKITDWPMTGGCTVRYAPGTWQKTGDAGDYTKFEVHASDKPSG